MCWRPNRRVEQELLQLDDVIVTPHVAWFSVEASDKLRRTAMDGYPPGVCQARRTLYPGPGVRSDSR